MGPRWKGGGNGSQEERRVGMGPRRKEGEVMGPRWKEGGDGSQEERGGDGSQEERGISELGKQPSTRVSSHTKLPVTSSNEKLWKDSLCTQVSVTGRQAGQK